MNFGEECSYLSLVMGCMTRKGLSFIWGTPNENANILKILIRVHNSMTRLDGSIPLIMKAFYRMTLRFKGMIILISRSKVIFSRIAVRGEILNSLKYIMGRNICSN